MKSVIRDKSGTTYVLKKLMVELITIMKLVPIFQLVDVAGIDDWKNRTVLETVAITN